MNAASAFAADAELRDAPRSRASSAARQELEALSNDFARWFAPREKRLGAACWSAMRADARRHAASVADMERLGLDLADHAPLALLPYEDRAELRRSGAFCHVLPGLTRDPRAWFADAGWTSADEWPVMARALFHFVRRCDENPGELWQACHEFVAQRGSRGFDSALLSPILNALRPDDFLIVNAATRATLAHFTGSNFGPGLAEYPEAQAAARRFIENWRDVLLAHAPAGLRLGDSFALFSHWLMNERMAAGDTAPEAPMVASPPMASAPVAAASNAVPNITAPRLVAPDAEAPGNGAPDLATITGAAPAAEVPHDAAPAIETPLSAAPEAAPHEMEAPAAAIEPAAAPADVAPAPPTAADANAAVEDTPLSSAPTQPAVAHKPDAPRLDAPPQRPERGADHSPEAAIALACAPNDQLAARDDSAANDASAPRDVPGPRDVPATSEPVNACALALDAPPIAAHPAAPPSAAEAALAALAALAAQRGQLLLCGRPGSGGAAWAEAVAHALRSGDGLSERLVFHPGWTRADFVQGVDAHGNRRAGRFTEFCRRATERRGHSVLLIHALQRADADAVFAEALELLDLRDVECSLSGSGSLAVPGRVLLVCSVQTADGLPPDEPGFTQHFACAEVPELPPPAQ